MSLAQLAKSSKGRSGEAVRPEPGFDGTPPANLKLNNLTQRGRRFLLNACKVASVLVEHDKGLFAIPPTQIT
jgi:hypothetical protein